MISVLNNFKENYYIIKTMIILKLTLSFVFSYFFIKLIIMNASKLGLTDTPNERSSHTRITPRGGGIGFGFAFFVSIILFNFTLFIENWIVFLAIFLVFLVGILDDHKDTSPKQKILVIFFSSLLLYFNDIQVESLGFFFGYDIPLGYIAFPFTLLFLVGFTNALNLIDGLDGLSTSISLVILSTL